MTYGTITVTNCCRWIREGTTALAHVRSFLEKHIYVRLLKDLISLGQEVIVGDIFGINDYQCIISGDKTTYHAIVMYLTVNW